MRRAVPTSSVGRLGIDLAEQTAKELTMASNWNYPDPTALILQNVCNALAAYPEFYVQTLNVMRSLNLAAPFSSNFNLPILYLVRDNKQEVPQDALSSRVTAPADDVSESEEDDEQDEGKIQRNESGVSNEKRLRACNIARIRSSLKQAATTSAVSGKSNVSLNEVFDVERRPAGAISINIRTAESNFGLNSEGSESTRSDPARIVKKPARLVTDSELARGKLSAEERTQLKLLENYSEGVPSNRVYVKNVDKLITEEHLTRLFGRYVAWDDDAEKEAFKVQVMTGGRMHGQAFVTFLKVEQAESAVCETNTFRFSFDEGLSKPLIVQFAKAK